MFILVLHIPRVAGARHSREGGIRAPAEDWMPAYAGMTGKHA
jgi:hypothetical protein